MITLTIPGSIPSKKNSKRIFCHGRRPIVLPSERHEAWEKEAGKVLAGVKLCPNPALVEILFFWPDLRKADLSNKAESIMDLLVKCGILLDDSWQIVPKLVLISGGLDRQNPRAIVMIQ